MVRGRRKETKEALIFRLVKYIYTYAIFKMGLVQINFLCETLIKKDMFTRAPLKFCNPGVRCMYLYDISLCEPVKWVSRHAFAESVMGSIQAPASLFG